MAYNLRLGSARMFYVNYFGLPSSAYSAQPLEWNILETLQVSMGIYAVSHGAYPLLQVLRWPKSTVRNLHSIGKAREWAFVSSAHWSPLTASKDHFSSAKFLTSFSFWKENLFQSHLSWANAWTYIKKIYVNRDMICLAGNEKENPIGLCYFSHILHFVSCCCY